MLIGMRDGMMSGKSLPYDAEVEYLACAASRWIDTGIYAGSETRSEIEASIRWSSSQTGSGDLATAGAHHGFGKNMSGGWLPSVTGNSKYLVFGLGDTLFRTSVVLGGTLQEIRALYWLDARAKKAGFMIAGGESEEFDLSGSTISGTTARTLPLGAVFILGPNRSTGVKLFAARYYQGDELVRDFIPVRAGETGYMFDRVTKELFGSAGSSSFSDSSIGPDVTA